jgi:hypothetical protein
MPDPDFRALCEKLMNEAIYLGSIPYDQAPNPELIAQARAALAQPEPMAPTDDELLELMPETMRAEFSFSAKVCSDATGAQVKPGLFRVVLNTAAVEYARAVLAKWGHQ